MATTIFGNFQAAAAPARQRDWDRFGIRLGALASVALALSLTLYGFRYYTLDPAQRALSALHRELKPGGSVGHPLGVLGGLLVRVRRGLHRVEHEARAEEDDRDAGEEGTPGDHGLT